MALINLKNGKTIDVDIIWYLSLSDEELQDLEAMNIGIELDNPFYGSAVNSQKFDDDEDSDPIDIPERDDI